VEAIKEKSECGLRPIGAYAYAPAGMRSAEFNEGGIGNLSNAELGMRNAEN
jgi:hypothetical protein